MILPSISDLILQRDIIFKIPLQSDTVHDLIHFVGHCDQYFMVPLCVNLLCNRERQAPIRRAPLSSDNSCYCIILKSCEVILHFISLYIGGGRVVRICWVNFFLCRGVLLIWVTVGQGIIALVIGACRSCLDIFLSLVGWSFWV